MTVPHVEVAAVVRITPGFRCASPYPDGFVRAGGATLPLKERRDALDDCIKQTEGVEDTAKRLAIVGRIVRKKWKEVAPRAPDITNFSFGPTSVPTYADPDAGARARAMLHWLPTSPEFSDCLEQEEMDVWSLTFSDHTQAEVAASVGKAQGTVSKIIKRAVRKLNERYRELDGADQLPLAVAAWVKSYVGDDSGGPDLYRVVEFIRQRDRAQERGTPIGKMKCRDMDELRIRHN